MVIKKFYNQTKGVEVTFEGLNHIFYGTVSMIIADNLAAHALAGFYCNFSTVNRFVGSATLPKQN